jgi:hypothetical protein
MTLSELVGGMTIIPPMPVQDVEREVLKHALEQLPTDFIQSELSGHFVGGKD